MKTFKRISALILTIISAACVAVGFSGCKDEITLPPMTEAAPVVATSQNMDLYQKIDERYNSVNTAYENFLDYYNNEFRQICSDKFYYINMLFVEPEERSWFTISDNRPYYIRVKKDSETEDELVDPVVNVFFSIRDIKVGTSMDLYSAGPSTVYFDIYFTTVMEDIEDEQLTLKFGNKGQDKYDYYINLYKGDVCIGTAYFGTEVSIPYDWFEDFFTRHLVYGG